jgi:hypothetical protein
MDPRRRKIPFDDVVIMGLRTLKERGYTHEEMAEYYALKLQRTVSRRTVERRLKKLEEGGENSEK